MQEFQSGPFEFCPVGRALVVNSQASQRWAMSYGPRLLAEHTLPAAANRGQVAEAFGDDRTAFVRSHQVVAQPVAHASSGGYLVRLVCSVDRVGVLGRELGRFLSHAPIDGLSAGLIDDRHATWLIADELGACVPMDAEQFGRLQQAHEAIAEAYASQPASAPTAPPLAWVSGLLPGEVLTLNSAEWRAPTSWELRHVVGEGSFTGVSGAGAAALVGVQPQGFRKYTASESASSRQSISFAMWHLLLHRLGVQRLPEGV